MEKGYLDRYVCLNGENSHDWEQRTMSCEGINYIVQYCKKCDYYY